MMRKEKKTKSGICYSGIFSSESLPPERIYNIACDSVCPFIIEYGGQRLGLGSSFVYKQCIVNGKSKLYFLTNLHVIQEIHTLIRFLNQDYRDYRIYVKFKGEEFEIKKVFIPPWEIYEEFLAKALCDPSFFRFDFSVFILEWDSVNILEFFSVCSDSKISPGEEVYALGYPRALELSIAKGIISHVYDSPSMLIAGNKRYYGMIQHDILINPGNSGGPTVNKHGEVVGISTFGIKDFTGLNFSLNIRFVFQSIVSGFLREFNLKEYIERKVNR